MNGPWSNEVSLVDPGVTQTQWWPSFYRKNKNRDPQAHGPRCGRGLDMAILKKERKEELSSPTSEGMFWIWSAGFSFTSAAWCFVYSSLPEESWTINTICSEPLLFLFDFSNLRHGEHGSLRWCLHLPCQQIFDQHLCWEHRAWQRGGRSAKVESGAFIWPHGTMWSPHPPCVRAPTPQLASICKGNWPNLWLCVGGWGSWLSASTPTACPQEWRTTDILVLLDKTFGSHSTATGGTTSHPRLDHQEIKKTELNKQKKQAQFLQYLNNNYIGAIYFTICSLKLRWLHNALSLF